MEADSNLPTAELDDDDAITGLKARNAILTERFVRQHMGWMLAVATRIVRDAHHAEDAVQNAFAKVFGNIDSFNRQSALKTWMHRIVVNESLMLLRKTNRAETVPIDDLLPMFDTNGCRIEDRWATVETPELLAVRSDIRARVNEKIG
ncbi:MAG: sigma-70 family RNA polymerase sigma factor [Hyphomicrobiales bacterium]|nr:sigma-70 family RNA polymerase sigma factor [Hyphomicrobiales bacterium]MCP5002306.1 sigma-70 family RNA polymerase sigma factor [Hyphomicrobiales bacterium]